MLGKTKLRLLLPSLNRIFVAVMSKVYAQTLK